MTGELEFLMHYLDYKHQHLYWVVGGGSFVVKVAMVADVIAFPRFYSSVC